MPAALRCAQLIAAQPLSALVETKALLLAARADGIRAARAREARALERLHECRRR